MRIIPDLLTQEMEFLAGAVDYYGAQPHQVARYKNDPQYQSFSTLRFVYTYIGYNNRKALFAEPAVRKALGMAINVEDFLKYLLYGEGERTTGLILKIPIGMIRRLHRFPMIQKGLSEYLRIWVGRKMTRDGWRRKEKFSNLI